MKELEEKEKEQDQMDANRSENRSTRSKNKYKKQKTKKLEKRTSKFYKFKDEDQVDVVSNWAQNGSKGGSPKSQIVKETEDVFDFNFQSDLHMKKKKTEKPLNPRKNQSSIFNDLRARRQVKFDFFQTSNENKMKNQPRPTAIKNLSMVNIGQKKYGTQAQTKFDDIFIKPPIPSNTTRHKKTISFIKNPQFDLLDLDITPTRKPDPSQGANKYDFLDDLNAASNRQSKPSQADDIKFI